MRKLWFFGLLLTQTTVAWSQEGDLFEFFAEEAQVVTASRRPQPLYRAPATVYVVSGEELRTSGAQTLWDGLRSVPGVDVANVRSLYGAVSIRGLNKPLNNRTLVLVDGRMAVDGYLESANWEGIPVLMEEIDRIEVVEGPTSALYGGNAVNGVINIITRRPEQLQGGEVNLRLGENATRQVSYLYGKRNGGLAYKLGMGWRAVDRFEEAGVRAGELAKFTGLVDYGLGEETQLSLSGGMSWGKLDMGLAGLGKASEDGKKWYARGDYVHRNTRARIFWNGSDTRIEELPISDDPRIDYDTYEGSLEQAVDLSTGHSLVIGASFRHDTIDSKVVSSRHNLFSLYFEDEWRCGRLWTLWSSGRLDRHPHSGLVLSPRLSLVFVPTNEQVLRFSTGTSFRNPTQIENHTDVVEYSETVGDFPDLEVEIKGSTELDPELMFFAEVVHNAQLGRLRTVATLFHYRLKNVVSTSQPLVSIPDPGVIQASITFINRGETRAWGGEAGAEWAWSPEIKGFVNYAYQRLSGRLDTQVSTGGRPRHKINGGVRIERGSWRTSISLHWVDWTRWSENIQPRIRTSFEKVDGYTLVNAHLGYRFPGRWRSLELGLDVFNLLNEGHFEILPPKDPLTPGQGGEFIRRRATMALSYRF